MGEKRRGLYHDKVRNLMGMKGSRLGTHGPYLHFLGYISTLGSITKFFQNIS